jgi:mannose-6-phosphate isomerase
MPMMQPFRVSPDLRARVWGGSRLRGAGEVPIGEAWLTGPDATVASGPASGRRLGDLAAELGEAFTGTDAPSPREVPVLVKLLDPAEWLSVQVHPDDAGAVALEGPGAVGKTEAWYCLEAAAGSEILLGVAGGVPADRVRAQVANGTVTALLERRRIAAGDAYLVRAGVLHAVGPGALIYEVQQQSDITYRVDDWGRPPSSGRPLHTRQALACVVPERPASLMRLPDDHRGLDSIIECEQFVLEVADLPAAGAVQGDPANRSLHVLTGAAGSAEVAGPDWTIPISAYETVVVPASAGPYEIRATNGGPSRVLIARVPGRERDAD